MKWKKDAEDTEKEMLGSPVLSTEGDRDRYSEYGNGGFSKAAGDGTSSPHER